MIKPQCLKQGDRIAIVSLSSGILGDVGSKHQVDLATRRFQDLGLCPVFMPHALKGSVYTLNHPEARAHDLKLAFADPSIRAIFCAIGGDDTYRIAPFLLEDPEFMESIKQNPKIFTGFSDTTNNHFLFYRLGLVTFYGPNVLNDIAELDTEMLAYSKQTVLQFFRNDPSFDIVSSPVWFEERTDFSERAMGTHRIAHEENRGYEVLNGVGKIRGRLLGGCLESLYEMITNSVSVHYDLVPSVNEWTDAILFLETSEELPSPQLLKTMLVALADVGILGVVAGIVVGKPLNEVHYEAYKDVYRSVTDKPILYNVNFGHAYPRTLIPYGLMAEIDFDLKRFCICESMFAEN